MSDLYYYAGCQVVDSMLAYANREDSDPSTQQRREKPLAGLL